MANGAELNWIWKKDVTAQESAEPIRMMYRKTVTLTKEPEKALIDISADTRYKLFVNGAFVEMGPSRGDRWVWYYDTINLLPYLKSGENVIAVFVLRYPLDHSKGNHGMHRTERPGLYVKGKIEFADGSSEEVGTGTGWKVKKDESFSIISESEIFAPLQIYEEIHAQAEDAGWMLPGFDDSSWEDPMVWQEISRAISPGNLHKRTIPYLFRKPMQFDEVVTVRDSSVPKKDWSALIRGKGDVTVPAGTKAVVEISASVERTGYIHLDLSGGEGAKLRIVQAESYIFGDKDEFKWLRIKGQRDDWENGYLDGFSDTYAVAGYGRENCPETYEPFWFRTFRYIKVEVETGAEDLTISRLDYELTGYPLEVKTQVTTSDASLGQIWEISERSLRNCMHETYEDCPYYEQLQYAMDSRSQILYTYATAADDRLARKCMDDFRRSQRYDGLLNCSYPNFGPNVIPTFSIFYILMLYDHMMYFGDMDLLIDHMPTVEKILGYFRMHSRENGYVEKIGGLNGPDRFWSFIDWAPEWDQTNGVPTPTLQGAITMETLLYIMGLQHAAKIAEYTENRDLASRYDRWAREAQEAVREHCMGAKGMLTDGPGVECYSQHTQVFALLTDTVDIETGRQNLLETIAHREDYPQCSVAMAYYLFRALEKADLYEKTNDYWDIWRTMIQKGATTCIEDQVGERSECHAWGALALFELPSVILGVRPTAPGYEAVRIEPVTGYLTAASGKVITPKGYVSVEWSKNRETGEIALHYELPEGLSVADPSATEAI